MFDGCDYLTSVQHLNGNHWASIHGVNATAGCYLHVIQHLVDTPGGDLHEMGGVYDDQLILQIMDGGSLRKNHIKWSKATPLYGTVSRARAICYSEGKDQIMVL